jgi:hypothetical protein
VGAIAGQKARGTSSGGKHQWIGEFSEALDRAAASNEPVRSPLLHALCAVPLFCLHKAVWRADEALSQQVAADDEWCHCAMVGVRHDPASARSCVLQAVMIEPLCVGTCVHGDSMVGVRHDATAEVEPKEQPSARREFRVSTVFHPSAD